MKTTIACTYFAVRISGGLDALIEVAGELDLASVPTFEAAVRELDLSSRRRAVLDLGRLAFIDAAGLHSLVALHAECLNSSTALTITPGARNVQRVFELTGFDGALPFRCRRRADGRHAPSIGTGRGRGPNGFGNATSGWENRHQRRNKDGSR
jgi:anti-sigma B factor antagonist